MRKDEKEFFIALLKEVNFKSYEVSIHSAYKIADRINLNRKRAKFLLEKWFDLNIWNCDIFANKVLIDNGWFELENLVEPYKEIYDKYMQK